VICEPQHSVLGLDIKGAIKVSIKSEKEMLNPFLRKVFGELECLKRGIILIKLIITNGEGIYS